MEKSALVIINPTSGQEKAASFEEMIRDTL